MRVVVAALALAGCDALFGLHPITAPDPLIDPAELAECAVQPTIPMIMQMKASIQIPASMAPLLETLGRRATEALDQLQDVSRLEQDDFFLER